MAEISSRMGTKTERDGSEWYGEFKQFDWGEQFIPWNKTKDAGTSGPAPIRALGAVGAAPTPATGVTVGSLGEGAETPFGAITGGLPQGFGLEWHKLLLEKGQQAASEAIKQAEFTGQFNGVPTLERERIEAAIAAAAADTEIRRRLADNTIRETDLSFAKNRFHELETVAKLASNPRNYIEASFLGNARGTLAGQAPNNQIDRQPGSLYASSIANAANPLGTPGSVDHYATQRNPDGSAIDYYGNAAVTPTGDVATVPVGAFSRALMEGRPVPTAGNIGTTGGYATTGALRNGLQNLDRIKVRDYLSGTDSERQQFGALASYSTGMSDEVQQARLKGFVPRDNSVSGGIRYAGAR